MRHRDAPRRVGQWRAVLGAVAVVAGTTVAAVAPAAPSGANPRPTGEAAPWIQLDGATNGCTTTCPSSPSDRGGSLMAYDAASHQMILFGGLTTRSYSATFNDTWDWTGTGWTELHPATSPPSRAASAMTYDAATGQLVLFGGQGNDGQLNDTWTWNGSNWTQVADTGHLGCGSETDQCSSSPPYDSGTAMAYDPATNQVILLTGYNGSDETWDWDGSSWSQLHPATSPPSSTVADLAYDPSSSQLVLFGGQGRGTMNDTWTWNGSTWAQVDDGGHPTCGTRTDTCPSSPPRRSGASMAYDPTLGGLVLFGGLGTPQYNDTWLWNGTTWTQIDDNGAPGCGTATTNPCPFAPTVRSVTPFARDASTGQIVLFGGQGGSSYGGPFLNDTWVIESAPTTTTSCIPSSRACETGAGTSTTVTSGGVKITSTGRGTVAVGIFRASEVPALKPSTGKFFGVSVSSENALKSLVVNACDLGGGGTLLWWNGKAWVPVVGQSGTSISSSGGCLSVTLGTTSSPSIATIARQSRLSRFGAVVFGVA